MNQRKHRIDPDSVALTAFTRLRLRMALFLSGASVMIIQILGTRIIGPHFGVGLFVWTSLITVTMVALALGYWLGGKLADRRPSLLFFSGILLTAAAAVALIPLLRGPVLDMAWTFSLRAGSLCAATILFLPPLFLLGMISPFAVRLEADDVGQAGSSAGRLYAISTTGSVVGAVSAGFLLVPSFRVPTVLAITAGLLVLAALLAAAPGLKKRVLAAAAAVVLGGVLFAWPRPWPAELLAARSSDGTDLRVISHEGSRYLFVDQAAQTSINSQGRANEKYIYFLASRLLLARPQAKKVALIGLGGGGIVPLLTEHGMEIDCVDLSPAVIELARAHFGFSQPPSKVHAMDGRVFLKQRPASFDTVILDVFTGDRLAYPLVSLEGLQTAKAALTPGGLLALNTWGIDEQRGAPNQVGAAIYATLQRAFRHVLAVPAAGNLLFFASDEPIEPQIPSVLLPTFDVPRHFTWLPVPPTTWPDAPVLTDDWNPVDTLDTAPLEALRLSRKASFPDPVRDALAWE
jgi:spermidine synthase